MPAKIYYYSDREHHKKVARDYYQNNKESILEHKKNIYNNLSKEEKKERATYAKDWYNNLSEDIKNIKRCSLLK